MAWEWVVLVAALLVAAGATVLAGQEPPGHLTPHLPVVVVTGLVIGLGELLRVTLPTGRSIAPVSTVAAMSLILLGPVWGEPAFDLPASSLILVVGLALVAGVAARRVAGLPGDGHLAAIRFLAATVAVLLWRVAPTGPVTASDWSMSEEATTAETMVTMLGVSLAAIIIELVLSGLVRAQRQRARWAPTLRDELTEAWPLTLTLVAGPPVVALAAPILSWAALLLVLGPLWMAYAAIKQFSESTATYREMIGTLSRLTEAGGYTPVDHGRRVATLAVAVSRRIGMVERDLRDVEYTALLHDLGQIRLRTPIPGGATVNAAPGDQRRIAEAGADILRHSSDLQTVAENVALQSIPYHLMRSSALDVPLASRIIKVTNAYDDLTAGDPGPRRRSAALERINLGLGYEYDPEIVEALVVVTDESPGPRR